MSGGEFAAIEARLAAATEGPWIAVQRETQYGHVSDVASMKHEQGPSFDFVPIVSESSLAPDAAFIAAARTDIPTLLAAVRERDNTIARIREVLDDYDGLNAEPIPKLSTHTWMHEVRAALDPQETP